MATVFQKLRTLTLSNIHGLLDKAIDLNSVEAIKQHVRDLEAASESIADEAAVAKGGVQSKHKQITELTTQIKTTNENIDLILSDADPSNDNLAEPLEARLIGFEESLKVKQVELEEAEKLAADLSDAATKIEAKHQEMLSSLRRLEAMDHSTKAKEKAASAIKQAGELAAGADSVDNVTQRLEERDTVASARLERALGSMSNSVDMGVIGAQAKDRIAARRAKLSGGAK